MDHLKDVLVLGPNSQDFTDQQSTVLEMINRLSSIIVVKGGHTEHFLISCISTQYKERK